MSNLIKYVKNNANKDFSEVKFNEVDAAIYAILPYLDLMGLINTPITIKELYDYIFTVTLEENNYSEVKSFSYADVITKTIKIKQ